MPIKEIEVKTIHQSSPPWNGPADILAVRDTRGREITIRRIEVEELIQKLQKEVE